MKVRFYHFSKRNKSTLQPAATDSYSEKDVAIKDKCSITHPLLLCQTENVAAYNYVYIPSWNRYYFISEAASVENMWEVALTEDYLATYKGAIGLTSANILYATGATKNIVDSRIPVLADVLIGHTQEAIPDLTITDSNMGAIILGITGKGSFGSYILKYSADISDLLNGLDDFIVQTVTDQLDVFKQFIFGGSASSNLKSAISLPFTIAGQGNEEDLYLGAYPCKRTGGAAITGYKITNPILKKGGTISIPWQSSDWKKVSAYSTIALYFPFIGIITAPATELQSESSITYLYSINITSGDISLEVRATTSGKKIATASGNCAMNTAYGNTGIDTNRATAAIASGLGTLLTYATAAQSGGLSMAARAAIGAGIASTAGNTLAALGGDASGSGGLGGGSSQGLDKVVHCFVIQKQLSDTQSNFDPIMGKPYMGVATVGSFTGFVQTDGFQLANNQAYSSEKDMVNQLLDSGIYYE